MTHEGAELAVRETHRVIDCRCCGFAHILPLPTAEEIEALYSEDFYANEKPDYLEKADREADYWTEVYAERFEILERLVGRAGRVLDLGCSGGWFLEVGRSRGWGVLGVEPSRQAARAARARGIPVHEVFLHGLDPDGSWGRFDAVHASLVVEHLHDPRGFFLWARDLLAPGGVLCVEVPNDFSRLQDVVRRGLGKTDWWVSPPHHVNYFTFESLEGLFRSTGFEVCLRTTTFPMELFLLLGMDYVGDDEVGGDCHRRRMALEQLMWATGASGLKADLWRNLAAVGVGREAIVFGRH